MARRMPTTVECNESDDETYMGYNNFCPALTTADIEEHGIGVLCRNLEGSSTNPDTFLDRPRTPFPTQQQLVERREKFRGFRIKTESRWMKTPRGIIPRPGTATTWEVDVSTRTVPQPGMEFYNARAADFIRSEFEKTAADCVGSPSTPGTGCGTRVGTASSHVGTTEYGSRVGTALSYGSRVGTALSYGSRVGTAVSYGSRVGTAVSYRPATPDRRHTMQDTPRPLSRIRAARYIPSARRTGTALSSRRTGSEMPRLTSNPHAEPFVRERVNSPLEDLLLLEKQICELFLACRTTPTPADAVKMARDAQQKEHKLNFVYGNLEDSKFPYNTGMTFAVIMNLANQLEANEMYREALATYKIVSASKSGVFLLAFRAKINMGNMYARLGRYPLAVKLYHMALDQVPRESASFRAKILRNLGVVFFKTNQLVDAISAFTSIMDERPSFTDGLNLMACLYALGCNEDMKTCFEMLLTTPLPTSDENNYSSWECESNAQLKCLKEGLKFDALGKFESKMKLEADKTVMMCAQLVAKSGVGESVFDGYDWCIERLKRSPRFANLLADVQIAKATRLMCEQRPDAAVELLEGLGDSRAAAATNLAFVHLTRGDLDAAERHSTAACEADCYSSPALVNAGCCLMARCDHAAARAKFTAAVENDPLCFEALYDLGLVNKRMGLYVEANCCFSKLHAIFGDDTRVLYQLASLHELTGDLDKAVVRYQQILCVEPRNALILKRVGQLFDQTGDLFQAHQYYLDSYRVLPSDVDVLIWLGIYSLNIGCPEEKAIEYIDLAIQCQPHEIKWQLMVAVCYQRAGDLRRAIECYEGMHKNFPDNLECLRRLVKMCMPLDYQKAKGYALELKRLEKHRAMVGGIPSTPSPSTVSLCSQSTSLCSQTQAKQPIITVAYDTLDSSASTTTIGEEYCPYSRGSDQSLDRISEEETCTFQGNTSFSDSRSEVATFTHDGSLQRCECDDEIDVNDSMEVIDTTNSRRVEVNWPGVSNSRTFYRGKLSSGGSVQCAAAASDPTCSAHARSTFTPRMLFTGGGATGGVSARCAVRMSDGDSRVLLHDELQGQQCWFATPRILTSRECVDDLGLRIFADSELGADLLPN